MSFRPLPMRAVTSLISRSRVQSRLCFAAIAMVASTTVSSTACGEIARRNKLGITRACTPLADSPDRFHGGKLGLGVYRPVCLVAVGALCFLESKPTDEHFGYECDERVRFGLVDFREIFPRNVTGAIFTLPAVGFSRGGMDAVDDKLPTVSQHFDVM